MLLLALVLAADVHSLGNPDVARPTHVALDLTLDFDRKVVAGTATLDVSYPAGAADRPLSHEPRGDRAAMAGAAPDHVRPDAVPLHAVGGHPRPLLDPARGQPRRADHLRRGRARSPGHAGGDERGARQARSGA